MPRTTTDKKESTIILRINDETRSFLEKSSKKEGVSLSKMVREIIAQGKDGKKISKSDDSVLQNEINRLQSENERLLKQILEKDEKIKSFESVEHKENRQIMLMRECAEDKGIPFGDFVDSLYTQLTWGMLEYKDGKIYAPTDEDEELKAELDNLRNACTEKNEDINQAIRKVAQQIWEKRL